MPGSGSMHIPGLVVARSGRAEAVPDAREVFERFVDLMYRRHQVRAAFESCVVRAGFIDHGGFRSRAAAMAALAPQLGPVRPRMQLLHAVCEGDIGMVHLAVTGEDGGPPGARVEIFRIADGRVVEHWSVAA